MLTKRADERRARADGSEQGSVVIAMAIVMILTTLSMAVLARTLGTLISVRRTQDFSAALASADGGLAEALFRLDQGQSTSFDNLDTPGVLGEGRYTYKATRLDDQTWTIRARGVVNGVPHAIQATVGREVAFPYAVFTAQTYDVNGNNSDNIYSYNSATGAQHTGNALVGSNRAIEIDGGGTAGDAQHYFTPDGSCVGCAAGVQKPGPRPIADPVAPTTYQACPPGGVFTGLQNGAGGLPFLCNQEVTFAGVVTVLGGPMIVHVGAGHPVHMEGASINRGATTRASDFRLMKAGTGDITVRGLAMTGVIYAPSADIPPINGGFLTIDGSLTVNSLRVNGGPHFHVAYDDDLRSIVSDDWKVRDWTEIPSHQF